MAGMVVLGGTVALTGGKPGRFDARTLAALDGNAAGAHDVIPTACLDWRGAQGETPAEALCPIRRGGASTVAFIGDPHVAQLARWWRGSPRTAPSATAT